MQTATVYHIGFGEVVQNLLPRLSATEGVIFSEIRQLSGDVQETSLRDGDVFLIGPYTLEPARQVQRAYQQNPLISIILLIFPDQFQKVKQAVQFAHNVGKNVTFVAYELGKDVAAVLDNAILRSRQRQSFARLGEQTTYPRQESTELTYRNLETFLEKAALGAIIFDAEQKVLSANPLARRYFQEVFQKKQSLYWVDLFPDATETQANMVEHGNQVLKVSNQFLEITFSPVEDGRQPRNLLLINDVTEKIRAENQLKAKVDELEFLNQELDEFVNVVSHDFKTPLTSIGLLAEMGSQANSPEKQADLFRQIKGSSNKLKELLRGLQVLVDIKKTRAEKLEFVYFRQRLDVILLEYNQLLDEIGATIDADFSQGEGLCYFCAHIDSFFSNLVTNAIKYRQDDTPLVITIRSRKENDYVVLSVKDNGTGIDLSRNLNKLFQPFKRLTDQGTGSGLGLSIVKRLIEKAQGYLEVYSQPGAGTEFKAYLKPQDAGRN